MCRWRMRVGMEVGCVRKEQGGKSLERDCRSSDQRAGGTVWRTWMMCRDKLLRRCVRLCLQREARVAGREMGVG